MKSVGEGGNQTTRLSVSASEDDKRRRLGRDIQAVLNLRLLCPEDAEEMADALGLSVVAAKVASVEAEPVGGTRC